MKMIKKLISISVILTTALVMGALVDVEKIDAAGDDVQFTSDTSMPIYLMGTTDASDLEVQSSSQVSAIATDTDKVNITLESGSDIIFKSDLGKIMTVTGCSSTYATFAPGTPSRMQIVYNAACTDAVLTIGTGGLTEANVKATPLTAATASVYTVTFRTVNALSAGDKIRLAFGTGYTIADTGGTVVVTDTTSTATAVASTFDATAATKEVIITLTPAVATSRVLNIVLTTVVTNPSSASMAHTDGAPTMSVLGIDLYTTTSNNITIDSLADQTPYSRIIELEPGWNIFAPSQALEAPAYATVLAPISGSYTDIYTLTWNATTETMTWQTPTTIAPLYGYAIYITAGSTVKLPLDFAKETGTNAVFSRNLDYRGWYLIGYTGSDTSGYMVAQTYCLDGLMGTGAANDEDFSVIVDLTDTNLGSKPADHKLDGAKEEAANNSTMKFYHDFGYAVFTITDGLVLGGNREENH